MTVIKNLGRHTLGPRNAYKDMLNNMVSPNDHVVMNHQNQTRTNGIWGHVLYTGNGQCAHYQSSVTNKPRKVTGRCPLLITHIRNAHQTTIVTTTSHRSCENDCLFGTTGNFGNRHQNKARYCEINIRDACGELASLMSQWMGHVLVMDFYGARYFVGKFVTGVPIEASYLVVSVCNEL
jgi:hypothetical protein